MKYPWIVPALAMIAPIPATAQDMGWSTIIPSVTGTDTLGLTLRGQMGGNPARSGPAPRRQVPADAKAAAAAFDYQPSIERRRANFAAFLAKARQRNAKAAAEIAGAFGSMDMIAKLGDVLAPTGLKINNVADAFTVYWIVSWQATQGNNKDFDRVTAGAVRDQVARGLGGAAFMTGAGDAAKQEFAETLLIQATLTDSAVSGGKGDPKLLAIVAKAARLNAGAMGIDLDAMRLTDQGFVPN